MLSKELEARVISASIGAAPKITLAEYKTFRLNTEGWRAIAPVLADDALRYAILHAVNNSAPRSGTYEDALINIYMPILMERVFGKEEKEEITWDGQADRG
jgi:hypothetical protein